MLRQFTLLSVLVLSTVGCTHGDRNETKEAKVIVRAPQPALKIVNVSIDSDAGASAAEVDRLAKELPAGLQPKATAIAEALRKLNTCKKKDPTCLERTSNSIMDYMDTLAATYPEDFDVQRAHASSLFLMASVPKNFGLKDDGLKAKAISAAQSLPSRFPNEPLAYGQLAHVYGFDSSKRTEVKELIKKCLSLDPQQGFCKSLEANSSAQ